jgi:cytochrome bd-type quinol oxidase subunit 2
MDFTQSLADVFSSIEIETPQGAVPYLNEKNAYNIALQMVTLFPALAIIFFNAISFFAQKLQYSLIRLTEGEEKLTPKARALIVSPFAGVTFLLAFIVSSLTQSTVSGYAISTVCDNVILILMPCLIIMGFMYYVSARTFGRKRLSTTLLILFVLLSFLNISLALLLVACVGAYASVSLPIITHINAKHNGE